MLPDAELEAALHADNALAPVTLAVRPGLAEVGELTAAGAEPGRYSPYAARWSGNPADLAAVREGRAGVQDEGSQLVAAALARADGPVGPWLGPVRGTGRQDRPAGRTRRSGRAAGGRRRRPHRARLVRQAVRAYPRRRSCWWPMAPARRGARARSPGCWSTLPCTGLGALRRRPESRWRRQPDDVDPLHRQQLALLAAAIDSTAPGGVVGYVTCSPHRRETVDVVAATLAARDDVEVVPADGLLPATVEDGTTGDYVQLWPHRHGTDAMFAAYLRRG